MEITNEMREYFTLRTRAHLYLVNKWSNRIAERDFGGVDEELLNRERDEHDFGKWLEPEFTPYIWITWRYREKRYGRDLIVPDDLNEKLHAATFSHIKTHKHHPEYWDDEVTIDSLNKDNRDKPGGTIVDGTKMPLTYIASMVADWLAMSEELGTCPKEWADKNINIRWKFTDVQVEMIYRIIRIVWSNK